MEPLPSVDAMITKLRFLGVTLPAGPVHVDGFGDSDALSEELLALIRQGRKRAGTDLVWAHEFDKIPLCQPGDIEIVVDHRGEPALVMRIVSVSVMPFSEVSAEYAAIEGEGDGSLEFWRRAHRTFFSRECKRIGREPSEAMEVVCNVFEVLHVLPRAAS